MSNSHASTRRKAGTFAGKAAATVLVSALFVGSQAGASFAADEPAPVAGGLTSTDSLFPNVGNTGYDVKHYDVKLAYENTTTKAIAATATIDATAAAPLSSFGLDFEGLTVNTITVNGVPATWVRDIDAAVTKYKLIITPATPVTGDFTTVITYSGVPNRHVDPDGSYEGWNATSDGASAVSEPVGTMTWLPSNNTPRDKATFDISLDVPSTITGTAAAGASNGELVSKVVSEDGARTTWNWEQTNPMATYLAVVSIGKFDVLESDVALPVSGRTIKEWSFVDSSISATRKTAINTQRARIAAILTYFETNYGTYPGKSTGVIVDNTSLGYALETQDRPYFEGQISAGTMVHEMAHQWFGNNTVVEDWDDMWLNEGPATYMTTQFSNTVAATETTYYNSWNGSAAANYAVPSKGFTDPADLFGYQTYSRGSQALEALRSSVGSAKFTEIFREWNTRFGGGSAGTDDFVALTSELTGYDMTSFWQPWLYGTTKPAWPQVWSLGLTSDASGDKNPGDVVTYTLTGTNAGKVPLTTRVAKVDLSDVLDIATVDASTLPAELTLDGTTLTWAVPSTATATAKTVTFPAVVKATASNVSAAATATADKLAFTCTTCESTFSVAKQLFTPSPYPTISGELAVGSVLTADAGEWAEGAELSYQWFRGDVEIEGATDATYELTPDDLDATITVSVSAVDDDHLETVRTATADGIVELGTLVSSVPTLVGDAVFGETLTAEIGEWSDGVEFAYEWFRDGETIDGATESSYTLGLDDIGSTISVAVTGTKVGYTDVVLESELTAAVVEAELALTPKPTLSGVVKVGKRLLVTPGTWDAGTKLSYAWYVSGVEVPGATERLFTLRPSDKGKTVRAVVTGTKPGYATVTINGPRTGQVAAGFITASPTPKVSGTAKVGKTLTAKPGTWDSGVKLSYRWYANGSSISGATKATFKLTSKQVGKKITVKVTATKTGYASKVKTSASTAKVAK